MRLLSTLFLVTSATIANAFAPVAQTKIKPKTSSGPTASCTALRSSTSATLPEGLIKTVTVPGTGAPLKLGDVATIKYSCYLAPSSSSSSDDDIVPPFSKSSKQKMVVGDGGMIDGFEKAIRSMAVGERAIVRITDPSLGYGAAGVPPLIPSNAILEMDLTILDSSPAYANIDFDSLAVADTTPRTAKDIAAAFEARQAAARAGNEPELEGLDMWIAKAKNFYFFGLFEGETGERPPWFLRPSITFPLAFLIVGAAFWVSLSNGAITERGSQSRDELDEIILSMDSIGTQGGVLLAMAQNFVESSTGAATSVTIGSM